MNAKVWCFVRVATLVACVSLVLVGCGGGSGGSSASSAPSAPSAPAAPVVTAGDGANSIQWSAVSGATSHTLYWSTTSPVDVDTAASVTLTASPHVHSGLTNAVVYYYVVTASNAAGESEPSSECHAMPSAASSLYDPSWGSIASATTRTLDYDSGLTAVQNGAALKAAMQSLGPGERLEVGSGTYSVNSYFALDLQGTAQAPIFIVAKSGETPVLTRPDASQNVLNVGVSSTTKFVCLQGFEVTGGSMGLRLYDVEDFWLDRCHVHHTGEAGVTANTADTERLHLTRNEVEHTLGTGEGFYLGANNGTYVMSDSVIALNHVHDTGGTQGDGIEIKQGSFGNWVAENVVHDTNYPCILLYGTGGMAFNLVEKNVCWNSGDNVLQVQGEAVVRNNLLMHGANAFGSHDHQGQVRDLEFVHNTLINVGRGAQLSNWTGRPGMVFANNVVYSQNSQSVSFSGGSTGVTVSGNVFVGSVSGASSGWLVGNGLADFTDVSWDATHRDATLSNASAILASGDPTWEVADDLSGAPRTGTVEAGCYDGP
ncbi:MAG: right-handed parallel beta-helix repeat-containing protein [Planctomycetes bacterium]|nr:right-handed parallel beta-helix repeat-containing protein [Planctomycetota bacterium]